MIICLFKPHFSKNSALRFLNDAQNIVYDAHDLNKRKELFKKASGEGEVSKVAIRNIRRDHIEQVKKLQKDSTEQHFKPFNTSMVIW